MAQEKFPTRPISIIIAWAPGGGGTLNAQTLQPHFEKAIGVGAVIVNKPGGGGTICWNYVANSPPDGYTVGIINPSYVITRYTTKVGVSFDKFDPIICTVKIPFGITVREDSPWKTFREFIDYAKVNPGKVQMGNGFAAMDHIGTLGIEVTAGVKFTHVPFKGTAPAITALLGGHVDGTLSEISTTIPYIQAKKFRVLALSSPTRNFALPDVPTFKEYFGIDLDVGGWYGYVVPKGTPKDRIKILHDAFKVAMDSEEFKAFYKKQGGVVEYMDPKNLQAFLNEQDRLWKSIIDLSGFKPVD
jgi:tripartite-type tricarboxylate transporter receptor subunit TctC